MYWCTHKLMHTFPRVDAYTLLHINMWCLILLILSCVRVPILMNGTINWIVFILKHRPVRLEHDVTWLLHSSVRFWDEVPISFMLEKFYTGQRHCVDCVDRICFFCFLPTFRFAVFARNTPVGLKLKHQPIPARNFPPIHRLRCWFVVSGDAKKVGWRTDGRVGCFKSSFLWLVGWIHLFQGYCRDACACCLHFFVDLPTKESVLVVYFARHVWITSNNPWICWRLCLLRILRLFSLRTPRRDIQRQIPFAIIRPSGVVSAASEPLPGWVDAYLLVEPLIDP